jgi:hypothetical protein
MKMLNETKLLQQKEYEIKRRADYLRKKQLEEIFIKREKQERERIQKEKEAIQKYKTEIE